VPSNKVKGSGGPSGKEGSGNLPGLGPEAPSCKCPRLFVWSEVSPEQHTYRILAVSGQHGRSWGCKPEPDTPSATKLRSSSSLFRKTAPKRKHPKTQSGAGNGKMAEKLAVDGGIGSNSSSGCISAGSSSGGGGNKKGSGSPSGKVNRRFAGKTAAKVALVLGAGGTS
jgi:hypothetical protein